MKDATATKRRRDRAVNVFAEAKIDALFVTSLHNVRYLTGFTGSNGALLLYRDRPPVFFTDPRYTVQSSEEVDCKARIAKGPMTDSVIRELEKSRPRRLGFEQEHLTFARVADLQKKKPSRSEMVGVSGLVENLRMVKDAGEIEAIRASVELNSRALENALRRFKIGMSERELAAEIDYQSRKLGAEAPAFDTIVAAGARAALPHAHPGAAKIGPGMLLIDMGAFRDGYASDMTRMAHVGAPPAKYKSAYRAVLDAQLAAIAAVRAGAASVAVDRAARRVLKGKGLDREFVHSTGHGLGLEIHEPPRLGRRDKLKLADGMAITIEPGIYIKGWGGIRIEDTVLVTETGCEIFTPTSKELRVI
jgi:Xaa-Pro aminopeptidase